jgi:WD40 repeat protein
MTRWCIALCLVVPASPFVELFSASAQSPRVIKPVRCWQGTYKAQPPNQWDEGGYSVHDAKTFAKFWKAWRGDEAVPEIDFSTHLVVVVWCPAKGGKGVTIADALAMRRDLALTAVPPRVQPKFTGGNTAMELHYVLAVYAHGDVKALWGMADWLKKQNTPGWKHGPGVNSLSFSPDSRTLASAGSDGTIKLWDIPSRKDLATFKASDAMVLSLSFGPDGKTLAASGKDRTLRLWDVATGKNASTIQEENDGDILFSPDGETVAFLNASATLWDIKTGKKLAALDDGDSIQKECCAFSPDGKRLAAATAADEVQLWHAPTGKKSSTLTWQSGDGNSPQTLTFSPDAKTLVTGTSGGEIRFLDVPTGMTTRLLDGHSSAIVALRFSPDGKKLAVGELHTGIGLWDVQSGKRIGQYQYKGETGHGMKFSADLLWAAAYGEGGDLIVWDLTPEK